MWRPPDYASASSLAPVNGRTVSRINEPIIRNGDTHVSNYRFDSIYGAGKDPYFKDKSPASILCMPVARLGGTHPVNTLR
jgi:hypothetical protein